jgi:hypothetical protein
MGFKLTSILYNIFPKYHKLGVLITSKTSDTSLVLEPRQIGFIFDWGPVIY